MGSFITEQKRIDKLSTTDFNNISTALKDLKDLIISEIAQVYAQYLTGVESTQMWGELIKFNRIGKLTDRITNQYKAAHTETGAEIIKALKTAMQESYYRHGYLFDYFIPVDFQFYKINQSLVDYALSGSPDLWRDIKNKIENIELYTPKADSLSSLIKDNQRDSIVKIKKSINNIFVTGKTFNKAKTDIKDTLSDYALERIYRTELTRLYNLGAYTAANESGLEMQKEWLSTLDQKTRTSHQAIDGQKVALDGFFQYSGDKALLPGQFTQIKNNVNCRCTTLYIFPGLEPETRRGKNPLTGQDQLFSWLSYEEWKRGLK